MKNLLKPILFALLLLGLCGCATTQQKRDNRISEAYSDFSTFCPEVQQQIRQGEIDIGFTEQMVYLALDRPDHVYTRKTNEKTCTIWSYSGWETSSRYELVSVPVHVRGKDGKLRRFEKDTLVSVDETREYDQLRVEFQAGKVSAMELMEP